MPIDVDRVRGAALPDATHTWDSDDVILYHLGVGAGVPPTDPGELEYVYEAGLKVLPTFATIPMFPSMMGILSLDGLDINPAMILHGGQSIRLTGPIPSAATVRNEARVSEVYDKGKGALLLVEVSSIDASGSVLFTNVASIFVRGEGGFGGDSGPDPARSAPERPPDHSVVSPTLPQQALLYRLSGDKNPLHADPAFAAFGGFDRPILHGLCSYGIVCKAAVETIAGGDVSRVRSFSARFTGVVYPGETLVTQLWEDDDGWIVEAATAERGATVISNARLELSQTP